MLAVKEIVLILCISLLLYLSVGAIIFYRLRHLTSPARSLNFYLQHYKENFEEFIKDKKLKKYQFTHPQLKHAIPLIEITQPQSKDWAVLIHRLGGTKECTVNTMRFLYDQGYNIVAYDQRNSGQHPAKSNGLLLLEATEALMIVQELRKKKKDVRSLLLFGESYGGATAAIAASQSQKGSIDALLLDCPLSDLSYYLVSRFPAAKLLFAGIGFWSWLILGISLRELDVCRWVAHIPDIPTFIYYSTQDTITPPHMAEDIYQSIPHQEKFLYQSQKTGHLGILLSEKMAFTQAFEVFKKKYMNG